MCWSDCKSIIFIIGTFFPIGCPNGKFHPLGRDPYELRHSLLLKNIAPQNTKDSPYPYFHKVSIRSFSSDYSIEEQIYISKAMDVIQYLLNLEDFRTLLEEIIFLENDPLEMSNPGVASIDQCGVNYIIPYLCQKIPPDRTILSADNVLNELRNTPKQFVFSKKKFPPRTVAIALIGGTKIIWNSAAFTPITTLELSFVVITLFHEMLHSFGYTHSTRIPYSAAKALNLIYKKYERTTVIQKLFGKFQQSQQEKILKNPAIK